MHRPNLPYGTLPVGFCANGCMTRTLPPTRKVDRTLPVSLPVPDPHDLLATREPSLLALAVIFERSRTVSIESVLREVWG